MYVLHVHLVIPTIYCMTLVIAIPSEMLHCRRRSILNMQQKKTIIRKKTKAIICIIITHNMKKQSYKTSIHNFKWITP